MAIISDHYVTEASHPATHGRTLLDTLAGYVRLWRQRARGRRQLAKMSRREVHDIGISVATAEFEAGKPFWRA